MVGGGEQGWKCPGVEALENFFNHKARGWGGVVKDPPKDLYACI